MSEQVEDLYLKGFMAFNQKDYKAAKAFWEQVLAADPNHAKAKQGLAKLSGGGAAPKRKRSSKEVFAEIKKLYGAKKFPEALKLTNLLLKKHPDNADLQGLRKKLEARVNTKVSTPPGSPAEKRNTMVVAAAAEESVASGEDVAAQVEKFIQQGVSLYEIQDYGAAIDTWNKALALDPNNRIAKDYVTNVSALLDEPEPTPDPEPAPTPQAAPAPEPPADSGKPSKEKMLEVYNEAMGLYKNRQFQEALERWNYILDFYPNHTETLQCVEKTKNLLSKEAAHSDQLTKVREDIHAGRLTDAESKLTRLSIEAPNLEGIDAVQNELDEAKQAATSSADSVKSLDLGTDDDFGVSSDIDSGSQKDFSATEDDITNYFGSDNQDTGPRKVVSAAPAKKKPSAPVNVFKVFGGVVLLAAVGIGGFFGYKEFKKRPPKMEAAQPTAVAEVDWNGEQQIVEDFFNFGSDFEDEGEFLLASYAYQRVEEIGSARLETLDQSSQSPTPEWEREVDSISDRVNKSKIQSREVIRKIRGDAPEARAMDLARTEMQREEFEEAASRLKGVLQADPKNDRARNLLGQAHERIAFKKLTDGDLSGASNHFKCSAVLLPSYDLSRRHMEVIQRYFEGDISRIDKDQWFFFHLAR